MSTTLPGPSSASCSPDLPWVIRMEHITKRFPGVVANQDIHLCVQPGTFHAVIGENGAGKSTLLNILYGRYRPDSGRIFVNGEEVTHILNSPADAIRRGMALVSQHYALIPALTVLENIMLGAEAAAPGGILRPRQAAQHIAALADQFGLSGLDLNVRAERLSVAAQQKVEILKALYRGARLLLLDEPTATLAPQEAETLFALLRPLAEQGATILFVTHKLREVMAHSSAITVLRRGRNAGDFITAQTSEAELLLQMLGTNSGVQDLTRDNQVPSGSGIQQNPVLNAPDALKSQSPEDRNIGVPISRSSGDQAELGAAENSHHSQQAADIQSFPTAVPQPSEPQRLESSERQNVPLLQIEELSVRNARRAIAVQNVSLIVGHGEILGIAGVDGSGQRELSEAIVGLRRAEAGHLLLDGIEITRLSVRQRSERGIAYIPEDRHRAGMVMDFTIGENYLLGHERQGEWGGGILLHTQAVMERATAMLRRYDVRAGARGAASPGRALSGGNQQKVIVARAIESRPRLLVACQPTRGLDVGASRFVYDVLRDARNRGMGVLLFSLDLDEILELSDRIAVMFNGHIAGVLPRSEATLHTLGALMTGAEQGTLSTD